MWNIHALIIQKKGLTKGKADKIKLKQKIKGKTNLPPFQKKYTQD